MIYRFLNEFVYWRAATEGIVNLCRLRVGPSTTFLRLGVKLLAKFSIFR
jgi:hypothetical protein